MVLFKISDPAALRRSVGPEGLSITRSWSLRLPLCARAARQEVGGSESLLYPNSLRVSGNGSRLSMAKAQGARRGSRPRYSAIGQAHGRSPRHPPGFRVASPLAALAVFAAGAASGGGGQLALCEEGAERVHVRVTARSAEAAARFSPLPGLLSCCPVSRASRLAGAAAPPAGVKPTRCGSPGSLRSETPPGSEAAPPASPARLKLGSVCRRRQRCALAGGGWALTSWTRGCVRRSRGAGGRPPCPAPGMLREPAPCGPLWLAAIFPTQEHFLPLISAAAGMHCCLFVVLLRED